MNKSHAARLHNAGLEQVKLVETFRTGEVTITGYLPYESGLVRVEIDDHYKFNEAMRLLAELHEARQRERV